MLACECAERVSPDTLEGAPDTAAVIVCGGSGTRLGREGGKQLMELAGRPVFAWSVLAFDAAPSVASTVVVCPSDQIALFTEAVSALKLAKPVTFAASGDTRQASVAAGLACVEAGTPYVAVHDGARPLIDPPVIEKILRTLRGRPAWSGAIAGFMSVDTVKVVDEDGLIESTPPRERLWCVQTPQCFVTSALVEAHAIAELCGNFGTDDASLVEAVGGKVGCVASPRDNIKITVAEDIAVAEAALAARKGWTV